MRLLLPLGFLLLFGSPNLVSQDCTSSPTAQVDLAVNGVRARLTTGGDLWWDGQDGGYEVTADAGSPNVNPVSAIFAGALWLGVKEPGGDIRFAGQEYDRSLNRFDYQPGPLNENGEPIGDCQTWDRFFTIDREDIQTYLSTFDPDNPDPTLIPNQIAGWPATENPLFESIHGFPLPETVLGMAPFWDEDLDGIYDPMKGDYPLFCGDQAIWCVFNDARVHRATQTASPLPAEIQMMAYAYADDDIDLHRTTFYDYKIINRGAEDWSEFYAGHWVDSDLGCFNNDLIGSDPEHNLFYVFNQNGVDQEPCIGGVPSYGETAPVNIFQVVNTSLDQEPGTEDPLMHSFSTIYNSAVGSPIAATTDPSNAQQYYNYLTGSWRDGTPITRGGLGYDTDGDITLFAFDGVEVNGDSWKQCNEINTFVDIRQVYSSGPYHLRPGQFAEFTLAITTIFDVDYPDDICPSTDVIIAAAEKIKRIYDRNCTTSALTGTYQPLSPEAIGLVTFPNPTSGEITFRLPEEQRIDQIEILDITGRVLNSLRPGGSAHTMNMGLPAGTYVYRLTTEGGVIVVGRVVVMD
jgi:hypothetical protein